MAEISIYLSKFWRLMITIVVETLNYYMRECFHYIVSFLILLVLHYFYHTHYIYFSFFATTDTMVIITVSLYTNLSTCKIYTYIDYCWVFFLVMSLSLTLLLFDIMFREFRHIIIIIIYDDGHSFISRVSTDVKCIGALHCAFLLYFINSVGNIDENSHRNIIIRFFDVPACLPSGIILFFSKGFLFTINLSYAVALFLPYLLKVDYT